ncbi:MAG: ATP-binding cassette domain-containing protein, partial [bacterium]
MLKTENLHIAFGSKKVLKGISFELKPKTITALMGTNGSGKTTLFNIITGFLKADSGKLIYREQVLNGQSPVFRNKIGIARTFQDLRLIKELTVKENIVLAMKDNPGENIFNAMLPKSVLKQKNDEFGKKAGEIIGQVYLQDVENSRAGEISYGQQKLLTLACCMANNPALLLLDEPVAGINPEYQKKIQELLLNLKKEGKTVLLIEHNSEFIGNISDKLLFL